MNKKSLEKQGEGAFGIHQTILELKQKMGVTFLEMGRLLKEIKDESYYQVLGYDSFVSYVINSELGFKSRTAYYYIEFYEWFITRLGFSAEYIGSMSQDKLIAVLDVVKKEFEKSDKYPILQLKERVLTLISEVEELRPVDFEKKYKDEIKQEGHKEYLAPPEYMRCDKCGKWKIILPIGDCCPDWIEDLIKYYEKSKLKKTEELKLPV